MGYVLSLVVILIWSFWFVISRIGVTGILGPIDIIFVRYLTALLLALPFWKHLPIKRLGLWRCILVSSCLGAVYNLFAFYGLILFQSNHGAVLISGAVPIFITLFALISRKPIPLGKYLAIPIIFTAIMLFLLGDHYSFSIGTKAWGIFLLLCASFCYSSGIWTVGQYKLQPKELVTCIVFFGFMWAVPLYIIWGDFSLWRKAPLELLVQAGYQGILVSYVTAFLISMSIQRIGSVNFSFFVACIPVLTTFFAILVGSTITRTDIIASIVCSIGIVVANISVKKT